MNTTNNNLSSIRVNFNKISSTTVELAGFTKENVDGIYIQATKDGKFYASGKFDGTWNSTVGLATKDDLNERFSSSGSGTIYNSVSDFPTTGSGFGVNTKKLTLYTGFVIPDFSRICFMNYGSSLDGALIAISPNGDLYSAFRSNRTWRDGKVR